MGIRQQQKEQRRWNILQGALGLFVRQGYAETTISQIAAEADMSMGLMFHYFDSKESLYLALVEIGAEGTMAPQQRDATSPDDYFAGFLGELFTFAEEQPWVAQMFVLMSRAQREGSPASVRRVALGVDQVERSAEVVREGQLQGAFREGDPMALASAFWSSVQGVMEAWAADPKRPTPEVDWLMGILRRGTDGNGRAKASAGS